MAAQTNASDWDALEQISAAVGAEAATQYDGTRFFTRGRCSSYGAVGAGGRVAHYFDFCSNTTGRDIATESPCKEGIAERGFAEVDMMERSCLNGWAFGNAGTSAHDAAHFFDELYSQGSILSAASMAEVRQYGPGDVMGPTEYGLGCWRVRDLSLSDELNQSFFASAPEWLVYEGHAGDDYGTVSRQGVYPMLNLSFSMMINRQYGVYPAAGANIHAVFCPIWRLLFKLLGVEARLPGVDGAFHCRFPHY